MTAVMYGAFPPDGSPRFPDATPPWAPPPGLLPIPLVPLVSPPPSYASNPELAAIDAISQLDEAARARVLRYLVSKFGPVT